MSGIVKKMLILIIAVVITVSTIFVGLFAVVEEAEAVTISNPKVEGGVTTWSCVYFGTYLQGSDENGEFKTEPIKWRVLSVNGDDIFLLSDKCIDSGISYNESGGGITWDDCTLRSWLNGYDSSENYDTINYTSSNFIDCAFSEIEKMAIYDTTLEDSIDSKTGQNTVDKIFLLTAKEAKNEEYGFTNNNNTRVALKTAYASKRNGLPYGFEEADNWWLRTKSPISSSYMRIITSSGGETDHKASSTQICIRPALHLKFSSSVWRYAGTLSSNGEVTSAECVHKLETKLFSYERDEENYHIKKQYCTLCGEKIRTIGSKSRHSFKYSYTPIDSESHNVIKSCEDCGYVYKMASEHDFGSPEDFEGQYEYEVADDGHYRIETCSDCGYVTKIKGKHVEDYTYTEYSAQKYNSTHHKNKLQCEVCEGFYYVLAKHTWSDTTEYYYRDQKTHVEEIPCLFCGEIKEQAGNHSYHNSTLVKYATLKSKAKISYDCYQCDEKVYKYKSWKKGTWYSADYNYSCKPLYKNKTKITLKLDKSIKGGTINLKIGKRSYQKKIKTNSKTITIKIKKPSYGVKISGTLKYKGKVIGNFSSENNHVWYSNGISKGMTKKQVKYARTWGSPKWTANKANGWSYWFYRGGSYIGFKNGKVRTWCVID